jgi:hypothetical protein
MPLQSMDCLMSLWLSMALQTAATGPSVGSFDLPQTPKTMTLASLPHCDSSDNRDDEVVVCGRKRDQYRLPLPTDRDTLPGPVRGEAQSGIAALTPAGRCGIFAGERRCNKKEAAEYGYGNGRDPITLLTRLAQKAVDRDGD